MHSGKFFYKISIVFLLFTPVVLYSQDWKSMNDSMVYYNQKGDAGKIIYFAEKAKTYISPGFNEDTEQYRDFLWILSGAFKKLNRKNDFIATLKQLEIWYTRTGKTSFSDYADLCSSIGLYYKEIKNYTAAEKYLTDARSRYKQTTSEWSEAYLLATLELARVLVAQKKYYSPGKLYEEIIQVASKKGIYSRIPAIIYEYGKLKTDEGEYGKASEILGNMLSYRDTVSGQFDSIYTEAAIDLSTIQIQLGQYGNAEAILKNTAVYAQQKYTVYSSLFFRSIFKLADFCLLKNRTDEAEKYLNYSLNSASRVFGNNSLQVAGVLIKLSSLLTIKSEYQKAKDTLTSANRLLRNTDTSQNGVIFYQYYKSMGELSKQQRKFNEAEELYKKAEKILLQTRGETSLEYYDLLNSLAALHQELGEKDKAKDYLLKAHWLQEKHLPRRHPVISSQAERIILFYEAAGLQDMTAMFLMQYAGTKIDQVRKSFPYFSEYEKNIFLENNAGFLDHVNSSAYNFQTTEGTYLEMRYLMNTVLKSLTLTDTYKMWKDIRKSTDPQIISLINISDSLKTWLEYQYSLSAENRSPELNWNRYRLDNIERHFRKLLIPEQNDVFETDLELAPYLFHLKEEEAAIEFVKFRLRNKKWTDSTIYAAYVLTKNNPAPLFIPLCEENQLKKLFDSAGITASAMSNNFYRGIDLKNKSTGTGPGKELYNLIWAPLEPFLTGIKKIIYAPAGKLYSVAFHALPVDSTMILMDKYELQQCNSTRQVILRDKLPKPQSPISIAFFGDAVFNMDSSVSVKPKGQNVSNFYTTQKRGSRGGSWGSLPGTAEEVKKIKQLFDQNKLISKSYTRAAATEKQLKALSGTSPQVLHVATHGFFLPVPDNKRPDNCFTDDNIFALSEDPLLRSGLIFTGGNSAWSGKTPVQGVEDGIATAYEISHLDLSNTELVVLSACETALGDVKGSEGVFGLQRAFKMAGVKKMIVSLWQVPDKETAELMTTFYNYWLKGKTIEQAFAKAQADMRKKYSPYYWAAFVLVE